MKKFISPSNNERTGSDLVEKILIKGGSPLNGTVAISGAKNSAVAILPATLLAQGECRLENIPDISDVNMILKILESLGAKVERDGSCLVIDTSTVDSYIVEEYLASNLRASYYFMGALLARFNKAVVAKPGGCNFCTRPMDQHLRGFKALGADVVEKDGVFKLSAEDGLSGAPISCDVSSVGATINIMLAAVKAKGTTFIEHAAKEPHIVDLANFLGRMGAEIKGAGTDTIRIRGVETLTGCEYQIIPDQIEAGTFMVAAVATGGAVAVNNVIPKHLESITSKLVECGATVRELDDAIFIVGPKKVSPCNVTTAPHPGFPTDMQPQFAALLSVAEGTSKITENVWERRFGYIKQLQNMGAEISVTEKTAVIEGSADSLHGCCVVADDLRAGAAMIIAGLAAEGITEIENIIYIDRGYEDVVSKFEKLGANIWRADVPGISETSDDRETETDETVNDQTDNDEDFTDGSDIACGELASASIS